MVEVGEVPSRSSEIFRRSAIGLGSREYPCFKFCNIYEKRGDLFFIVPGVCTSSDTVSVVWNIFMTLVESKLDRPSLKHWLTILQESASPKTLPGSDRHHITQRHKIYRDAMIIDCCELVNGLLRGIDIPDVILRAGYDLYDFELDILYEEVWRLESLQWVALKKTYRHPIRRSGSRSHYPPTTFTPRNVFDSAPNACNKHSMTRHNRSPNFCRKSRYPRSKE